MDTSIRYAHGFTLIELMIAVVIVGILAAIAYPSYQNQVQRTRRADGQAMLMEVMAAQERFYSSNNAYTTTLAQLGYTADGNGNVASDAGWYLISAAQCGAVSLVNCVLLTATGQLAQAADAALTLDSRNNRTGPW